MSRLFFRNLSAAGALLPMPLPFLARPEAAFVIHVATLRVLLSGLVTHLVASTGLEPVCALSKSAILPIG
jgi:hypothetical protein